MRRFHSLSTHSAVKSSASATIEEEEKRASSDTRLAHLERTLRELLNPGGGGRRKSGRGKGVSFDENEATFLPFRSSLPAVDLLNLDAVVGGPSTVEGATAAAFTGETIGDDAAIGVGVDAAADVVGGSLLLPRTLEQRREELERVLRVWVTEFRDEGKADGGGGDGMKDGRKGGADGDDDEDGSVDYWHGGGGAMDQGGEAAPRRDSRKMSGRRPTKGNDGGGGGACRGSAPSVRSKEGINEAGGTNELLWEE